MFARGSRYETMPTELVRLPDNREVMAVCPPLPAKPAVLGFHRRLVGQRLDHIAAVYLNDPTAFWRLCDANGAMVPAALANRDLIGIPEKS